MPKSLQRRSEKLNQQKRKDQRMLSTMIMLAATGHEGQLDRGDNAYILHPIRLMMKLRHDSVYAMMVAIGHDLIEDTDFEIDDLRRHGIPEDVLTAIDVLTHKPNQSYVDYIIEISKNALATRVKMQDLYDNSDLRRMKGATQKDFDRMTKYQMCHHFLEGKTSVNEFKKSMRQLETESQ